MEEVWKHINLSSLSTGHPHQHLLHSPTSAFTVLHLQNFPSSSSTRAPPEAAVVGWNPNDCGLLYGSAAPFNSLSLNSSQLVISDAASFSVGTGSSGSVFEGLLDDYTSKSIQETMDGKFLDRRRKRLMRNRESAARSRARKKAYVNELEIEVAKLMEENDTLQKQQKKLFNGAAAAIEAHEHPRIHRLHRTSTAPF